MTNPANRPLTPRTETAVIADVFTLDTTYRIQIKTDGG